MDGFVILVEFKLRRGARQRFERLVLENAAASVREEPGCRRFDVLSPRDGSNRFVLYEIYDDRSAFEAHLQTPHFAAFRDANAELVEGSEVQEFDLQEHSVS